MSSALRTLDRTALGNVAEDVCEFLRELGGPVAIRVPGTDRRRVRVVTTLLHGNEPSGTRALHAWLRADLEPAVDALLVFANVAAAVADGGFAHRMLPGRRDLNRCFLGPFGDPDGETARAILDAVRAVQPEALVDIHNNTGHNPAYGVSVERRDDNFQLVSLFANRVVLSHLHLGALMEAVRDLPSATIEVGRSGEPVADAVALAGLERFLGRDVVLRPGRRLALQVLTTPMRVCLRPGVSLAVSDAPVGEVAVAHRPLLADLTLLSDLDRHNFETVAAGTPIGWTRSGEWPVELIDEAGCDRAREYFALSDGVLRTVAPIIPIMITTDPVIAAADCLFYVVRELEPEADA